MEYTEEIMRQQILWHEQQAEEKEHRSQVLHHEAESHKLKVDDLLKEMQRRQQEWHNCEGLEPCE